MPSLLAKSVKETLKEAFPFTAVKEEYFVEYKKTRLFFDFFLPTLSIAVEVQGQQHYKFNEYFHGNATEFKKAKARDSLKEEWAQENDITLVPVDYDEIPISKEDLLKKIRLVQDG